MSEVKNEGKGLTRRDFVKGAAVGAVGGLVVGSAGAALAGPAKIPAKWDYEADVVVIGFGFAGQAAAITAHDAGAKVIILEKAPKQHWGGNSAANYVLDNASVGPNVPVAIEYLRAECWGTIEDEDLFREHVLGNFELPAFYESLGAKLVWKPSPPTYPLIPGGDRWGGSEKEPNSYIGYPPAEYMQKQKARTIGSGWQEWMGDIMAARGIPVMTETPATELIQDGETNEILGVKALTGVTTTKNFHYTGGKGITIKAKKAVILACGGYQNNLEMIHNFAPSPHSAFVTFYGTPYNTGDGIAMATKVGAKLWHMNKKECHALACAPASKELGAGMVVYCFGDQIGKYPGIIVNRDGKRFYNEYHTSGHSDQTRPYDAFEHKLAPADDYNYSDYRHVPMHWIFDDTAMKAGGIGKNDRFLAQCKVYDWSKDNIAELNRGWFVKADTIDALAKMIVIKNVFGRVVGMNAAGLVETVNKYNQYCATGKDADFGRRPATLQPLTKPPFYAMEVCECQTNTQGGPKRNRYCQVLDAFEQPIPRLYSAGELGSIFGCLYNGGENIPEASSTGRRAAKHAVALKPWG